jgi:isocitrate dehydrogenase (NAD+)
VPIKVTLIPGDGIGPEVTEAARRAVDATGAPLEWEVQESGEEVMGVHGTPLPDQVIESIRRNKVALKGPITTPVGTGFRSVNVALRKTLDLYANLRPARTYPGVRSRYEGIDLVCVRENTEDLYAGLEHNVIPNVAAESIKVITRAGSERIARFAFEYARRNGRRKVTAVHKANIMKFTDGLFLRCCREMAEHYPEIEFEDRIVDAMCMELVQNPENYDVLVLPNLYGDIVTDLAAGLIGGLGVAAGANIGDGMAVFEPVHGSAPRLRGLNKANPTAEILSAVLMLRHLDLAAEAARLEWAVADVIREGRHLTDDMLPPGSDGPGVGTKEFTDAVIERLGEYRPQSQAAAGD